MSYLKSKAGSIEEIVRGMTKHANEGAYQDMFKKELEKAGKGIGAMTPAEKKAFFNKIDAKYSAKNEELTAAQKKLPPALQKAIKDKEDKKEEVDEAYEGYGEQVIKAAKMYMKDSSCTYEMAAEKYGCSAEQVKMCAKEMMKKDNMEEKVDNAYAVGMAAAMKKTGDKPPLKKSTITKAHDIAKSIEKDEKNEDLDKLKEDVAKLFETHTFRTKPMNDKQKNAGGEKEVINPIKKEEKKETVKMSEETAKNFDLYRAVHSVWTNAAEDLEEMKKNSKYMKADDVSTKEPEEQNKNESEKEKGKTMIGSQKTKVETEPSVDYTK